MSFLKKRINPVSPESREKRSLQRLWQAGKMEVGFIMKLITKLVIGSLGALTCLGGIIFTSNTVSKLERNYPPDYENKFAKPVVVIEAVDRNTTVGEKNNKKQTPKKEEGGLVEATDTSFFHGDIGKANLSDIIFSKASTELVLIGKNENKPKNTDKFFLIVYTFNRENGRISRMTSRYWIKSLQYMRNNENNLQSGIKNDLAPRILNDLGSYKGNGDMDWKFLISTMPVLSSPPEVHGPEQQPEPGKEDRPVH